MTGQVRRIPDITYGEVPGGWPLELDLYLPERAKRSPVIVHVHGGGCRRGSRCEPLLGGGFYPSLGYRLSGEARFPAQAAGPLPEDCVAAAGAADPALSRPSARRIHGGLLPFKSMEALNEKISMPVPAWPA